MVCLSSKKWCFKDHRKKHNNTHKVNNFFSITFVTCKLVFRPLAVVIVRYYRCTCPLIDRLAASNWQVQLDKVFLKDNLFWFSVSEKNIKEENKFSGLVRYKGASTNINGNMKTDIVNQK